MPSGTLEVFLVGASGLKKGDFFSKTDAYVVIHCGAQNQKSNVARNQGSTPSWNQRFLFYVEDGVEEMTLKVMDEDMITADDELGTVTIPLALAFQVGKTATTAYNVIRKNGRTKGEVKLALTFTPKKADSFHGNAHNVQPRFMLNQGSGVQGPYSSGSCGGWKQGVF